ncbi:MAG: TonB-dependent receptor plug domain-containing protein [Longimicrobiales bacterium]
MPILVATAMAFPVTALAQTPQDTTRADSSQVFRIEALSVRVPRPATTTGGAAAVTIRLDSISVEPAPTLAQVLREMPLIVIRQNSRGEDQPALRGAEDRQIAVLVDGIPITIGWDHRTDLSIVPLTAAREITLVRGLSSVLHGPNVLGGVIEIDIARGGEPRPAPRPLQVNASIDHVGGSQLGVSAGVRRETDDGAWTLRDGAGFRDHPGMPLADDLGPFVQCPQDSSCFPAETLLTEDGDLRLNSDVRSFDGFLAARYLGDDNRWISLSATGFTAERGTPPEIHEVTGARLWRYPSLLRGLLALSGGTGQQTTPWGAGDLEFSLGADVGETEIDEYAAPDFETIVSGEAGEDRTLTARLLADHSLGDAAELRTALTYADVSHDELLEDPSGAMTAASYRQRLWSLGAEAEWSFEGPAGLGATRLSVGGAVDGSDTPESGDKPPLDQLRDWGARAGVTSVVGESGSVLLHGGVSRRARFPALRELYSGALGRFEPNPGLRPEIMLGAEAGFTMRRGGAELQVVGFHQRLEDAIARTTVQTPEGEKLQRVNRNEIRSTGLELLGVVDASWITATADMTIQDVSLIDPEVGSEIEPEYEPTITGKLGAQVPLPAELVALGDARYVGDQHCVSLNAPGGRRTIDASATFDLGLRRTFDRLWDGALSSLSALIMIENATDAGTYDQCGLPSPGRLARFQIQLW